MLLIGVIVLLSFSSLSSRPQSVRADNGPTDIGSNPLQVVFRFPQRDNPSTDPNTWTSVNLSTAAGVICSQVSQQQCQQIQQADQSPLLSTPLGQLFDKEWSGTPDKNGQTMRDRACDTAKQSAASAAHDASGQTAYNISCNFPATGKLSAWIGEQMDSSNQAAPALGMSYYCQCRPARRVVPVHPARRRLRARPGDDLSRQHIRSEAWHGERRQRRHVPVQADDAVRRNRQPDDSRRRDGRRTDGVGHTDGERRTPSAVAWVLPDSSCGFVMGDVQRYCAGQTAMRLGRPRVCRGQACLAPTNPRRCGAPR